MSEILSTDDKENKTISLMKEMEEDGYVLVGQLNANGTYDDYVKKYIRYAGTNEGLRSRARNQKAVIDGGILKNDGTAFIFAKTSEFNEVMKKMNQMEDVIRVGNFIPGTDDVITEVGTIDSIRPGVRMVRINYQKNWIPLDIKTGDRMIPEKGIDVMGILMGDVKCSTTTGTPNTIGQQTSMAEQRTDILFRAMNIVAEGMVGQGEEDRITNIYTKRA